MNKYNMNFWLLFLITWVWFLFTIQRFTSMPSSDVSVVEVFIFLAGAFIFGYLFSYLFIKKQIPVEISLENKSINVKDDLKIIEGVGPAIEKVLNEAGVNTYADVALAGEAKIRSILEAKGSLFQYHNPSTWGEQAALLRDGKLEDFQNFIKDLKGGVRV